MNDLQMTGVLAADAAVIVVTEGTTGRPAEGVSVGFEGSPEMVQTDRDGVARVAFCTGPGLHSTVVASRGEQSGRMVATSWPQPHSPEGFRTFLVTDRPLYQPGEEIRALGWVRHVDGPSGDLELPAPVPRTLWWKSGSSFQAPSASGTVVLDKNGRLTMRGRLNVPRGPSFLQVEVAPNNWIRSQHEVQKFVSPAATVLLQGPPGPLVPGPAFKVEAQVQDAHGQPWPGAPVHGRWTRDDGCFAPPRWKDFSFGRVGRPGEPSDLERGRTDEAGVYRFAVPPAQ